MKKVIFYISLCVTLIYTPNILGQEIDKDELEANIDALVSKQVNDSTPGLVVGIVHKGELLFSKGYGLANLSYGIPNDSKMVYNIGSVSKQFLGYAFAMLHVKGALNIDDSVNTHLKDWPEFKHTVTLRHLLSHTSGYREAYTMSNLAGRIIGVDRLSRKECLEVVRKQPELEFIPGSRYTYNSTAWVILAEVLEKVTGASADVWVENNILQPLEMNDTQIESYVGEVIHNSAESYTFSEDEGYVNQESNRAIFGAAEVYTSIQDLVKWINNYQTAEIGGKAVNELFLDPFILNDGINSEYALGIRVDAYRGLKRYRHTGGHEAFSSQLSYFPDQDLGVVTISNYGGRGRIDTANIVDLLLTDHMADEDDKDHPQITIEKEKLEQFTGLYVMSTFNRTLDLTVSEGILTLGGRTKLIPTSENTFRIDGWNGKIQIDDLADGQKQLTAESAAKNIYTSVERWTPSEANLRSYEGDYWSEELETNYQLIIKDKKLTIQHRWLGEINLESVANDFFKTDWGYNVKFNRTTDGEISGLSVYSGRTLNVIFQRKE